MVVEDTQVCKQSLLVGWTDYTKAHDRVPHHCLCFTPISSMLNPTAGYYCLHVVEPLNHILYMDDLKLFAQDEDSLESMMQVVDEGSQTIGMSLGCGSAG